MRTWPTWDGGREPSLVVAGGVAAWGAAATGGAAGAVGAALSVHDQVRVDPLSALHALGLSVKSVPML